MENLIKITPWFGGDSMEVYSLEGTDKVAYWWVTILEVPDEPKTIEHLMVWHDCDKSVWLKDPEKNHDIARQHIGWHPANVGAHDFVSADPLHIEPSIYWPSCCGLHGYIRDGKWVSV